MAESRAMYQQPAFQPPRKGLSTGAIVGIVAGGLAVLLVVCGVIGVIAWRLYLTRNAGQPARPAAEVKAGDCLTDYRTDPGSARVVDCSDPDAMWRIVNIVENTTYPESRDDCLRDAAYTVILTSDGVTQDESTRGRALCVVQKRRG